MRVKAIISALIGLCVSPAHAQDAIADFYRGKQVFIRVGSAPGTGYDLVGRLVANYLGKYVPGNPQVVVQNVPGAGSLTLANQLYNTAAKDGTILGVVTNGMPTAPLLTPDTARFDAAKFGWIGSQAPETQIVMVWHTSPVRTIADLFTMETIVGGIALGTATIDLPLVMNAVMKTKFKIVGGYESTGHVDLAMERGEVQGQAGSGWMSVKSRNQRWMQGNLMRIVAQYGVRKHPDLQDVPLFDLPKDPNDRAAIMLMLARQEYGRPFLVPPGVPAERVAALRKAYRAVLDDPGFRADSLNADSEINPVAGEDLQKLTEEIMATPPDVALRVRNVLEAGSK